MCSAVIIEVKVTPNASKSEILGWEENRLLIRVRGVPDKGKVNANLIQFLAKTLDIAKSRIQILSGETSRLKRLSIEGISREQIDDLLNSR